MVLVMMALAALVETHRARSCAEGRDHCSDLAVDGVDVPVEYREEAVWELVADRARWVGTAVEEKDIVGYFEIPLFFPHYLWGTRFEAVNEILARKI